MFEWWSLVMTLRFDVPVDVSVQAEKACAFPPAILVRSVRRGFYRSFGKVSLDLFLVLLTLPVVLPLIAACALLVSLDGGAPLYVQRRLGRNGKVFNILKIRTMVRNADRVLESHLDAMPAARREWDRKQKLCHDPRITRVGRFLRKTSLDELPQVWNVLCGDMSLIGPRPMLPEQLALYPGRSYFRMRPGITGLWQVSDRNNSSFADRATYDTRYFYDLSPRTDLSILRRTIWVVLRGTGY